jgi:nucleoside-diphosphate-sugar epimerase
MVIFKELENTYKGKKVFITGHTGFKGAWLLKTLSLLGAEIKGYSLEPKTPDDLFYLTFPKFLVRNFKVLKILLNYHFYQKSLYLN